MTTRTSRLEFAEGLATHLEENLPPETLAEVIRILKMQDHVISKMIVDYLEGGLNNRRLR